MNGIQINRATLTPVKADPSEVGNFYAKRITHTVVIDFGKGPVTAYCANDINTMFVYGFVGKYRTGTKMWRVSVTMNMKDQIFVWFGRDDRSGNFMKDHGITWDPKVFFLL